MKTPYKALFVTLLCAFSLLTGTALFQESAMAQDDTPGKLIETFALFPDSPSRTFFDGKLKVELVSATADDLMKTIKIRISSRALKAEYGDEWQEHTYLEMLHSYVGSPVSGSPFKCAEGWLYYEKSENGGVTLSLRANPHITSSSAYTFNLFFMEHWKKFVVGLGLIGLAFALYFYIPFFWSFVSIQILARSHALETGFPSSLVIVYLIKRLPLALAFALLFHVFFNYGWKGVAGALVIGVSLQLYFNWNNAQQLRAYAGFKGMTSIEGSENRAFQGQVNGLPLALAVGGTFIRNPAGDYQSGNAYFHMSYIVFEVRLENTLWNGLELSRDLTKPDEWSASLPVDRSPKIAEALAGISRLPKYSIMRLDVRDGKLLATKIFAPDTPAEINLLVDLVSNVARTLEHSKP